MDAKDIITAVYGAILSTYNLVIARRERTRRIDVTLTWGFMGTVPEPTTTLILTAANPGHRPVSIHGCGLLLPDGKQFIMPQAQGDVRLPYDLEEGRSCAFYFPILEVVHGLISKGYSGEISLKAVFRDALGKTYESAPFSGDLEEWARMK